MPEEEGFVFSTQPKHLTLPPAEENKFRMWYNMWAKKAGIDPNPDNPQHKYDYRAAFKAGVTPQIDPTDKRYHWDSRFKDDDHPNRFVNGVDTKYEDEEFTFSSPQKEEGFTFSKPTDKVAPEQKQTILQKLGFTQRNPVWATMTGIPEAAAQAATGLASFVPGAVAQVSAAVPKILAGENVLSTLGKTREERERVSGALTYQPRTQGGQAMAEVANAPLTAIDALNQKLSEQVTEDPNKQAGIKTLLEAGEMAAMGFAKGAAKQLKVSKAAGKVAPEPVRPVGQPVPEPVVKPVVEPAGIPLAKEAPLKTELKSPIETPVTLTAVEKKLPKMAGAINLEKVGGDYTTKNLIEDTAKALEPTIKKRGYSTAKTWEMADEIAGSLDLTSEELMGKVRSKTKDLDSYITAARDTLVTSAKEVQQRAVEYANNPSPENEARYKVSAGRFAAIQLEVSSAASETGRALGIHRKLSQAKDYLITKQYRMVAKSLGKEVTDPEVAKLIATLDPDNPLETVKLLAGQKKTTLRQKIYEGWMSVILSNPKTHIVNMSSNLATELMSFPEKWGGATMEAMRHPKDILARELYFGQTAYSALGALRGFKEGLRRAAYAWENGVTEAGVSKLEIPTRAIKGKVGEGIRTPLKALMVEDEIWKGVTYTDELYSNAYKTATREGLRGADRKARVVELVSNPTEAMKSRAENVALYRTFQSELGKFGQSLMNMRRNSPGVEFIIPFVRTPLNITKYGLERTPLGIFRAIREKGIDPERAAQLRGATMWSSVATVILAEKVTNGDITGAGPEDPKERQALFRTGWQPYSVKIGDKYYSYSRLEPLATILGTISDFWEISGKIKLEDRDKIAAKIALAVRNNILNKTFFTGISDINDAIENPSGKGAKFINRLAGSAIPSVVAGVARALDPNIREVKTMLDTIKSRVPGWSQTLPSKITPLGEEVKKPGTPLTRFLSPMDVSKVEKDPLWDELNRLNVFIGMPSPTVKGEKMKPAEVRRIVEESGAEARNTILSFMGSPAYGTLSDENKAKVIKGIISRYRTMEKGKVVMERP